MTPEAQQRYNELDDTVKKLSNGSRGDPLIMSDGIVNISRTLQVILASNYVTGEQCKLSHEELVEDIKESRFGWKALAAVLIACSTLFGLGIKIITTIWGNLEVNEVVTNLVNYINKVV